MANAIVGQMLNGGVVKGGSGLKLRYGIRLTRATMDLDTACKGDLLEFIENLSQSLRGGWCGFSGTIVKRNPAKPRNVPPQYVMQPYAVRLAYNGQAWCTVDLEIGFNELGDADESDFALSDEVAQIFTSLGFPVPDAVPLMKCEYQIAQKLHGASAPSSKRAHDLIDLQLITSQNTIDLAKTAAICRQLFKYRRKQPWPATITKNENWDSHVMFVVEKDAKKVYRTKNQLEYIGYWEKEAAELRDALSGHGFESVTHQAERLKRIEMIKLNIGEFLSKVADANNPSEKEAIRAVIDRIQIAARRNSALTLQNVILSMLKKPHTVNDISKELDRSASTIRRHTKALRDKGAIEMTATGRTKQYQATRK